MEAGTPMWDVGVLSGDFTCCIVTLAPSIGLMQNLMNGGIRNSEILIRQIAKFVRNPFSVWFSRKIQNGDSG